MIHSHHLNVFWLIPVRNFKPSVYKSHIQGGKTVCASKLWVIIMHKTEIWEKHFWIIHTVSDWPNLQSSVLFLHVFHRVRDLLPGLQPLTGPLDEMIHSLLGVQPVGGVLQHVVELLRPVGEFGLRVFPVSLKSVNYNDRKKENTVAVFYNYNDNVQDAALLLCLIFMQRTSLSGHVSLYYYHWRVPNVDMYFILHSLMNWNVYLSRPTVNKKYKRPIIIGLWRIFIEDL